jgi:hypothetical protein
MTQYDTNLGFGANFEPSGDAATDFATDPAKADPAKADPAKAAPAASAPATAAEPPRMARRTPNRKPRQWPP